MDKMYLGDGVYARLAGDYVVLLTERVGQTDQIFLDGETFTKLITFVLLADRVNPEILKHLIDTIKPV
jgi:hypothetical protein